ncbi:MAG: recombination-associated protein RdgC, partial [Alteromonadaceae bacterium]
GMIVNKLALSWNESIHFIVDDQFTLKRLKYDDAVLDKVDGSHAETAAEEFDIEFAIMTVELNAFIKQIIKAFGGIDSL